MKRFLTLFAVALMLMAPAAFAEYETLQVTLSDIDTGTSISTASVVWSGGVLRQVICDLPAYDSGDTATLSLTMTAPGASGVVVPVGWTDCVMDATDDNAVWNANSTRLTVDGTGTLNFQFQTSTNQAADRDGVVVWLVREF